MKLDCKIFQKLPRLNFHINQLSEILMFGLGISFSILTMFEISKGDFISSYGVKLTNTKILRKGNSKYYLHK